MEAPKEVKSKVANVENFFPHDIIEIILLRLRVKDLIRFKVVSRQWKATISDPSFAQSHLQQYKNSFSSRKLLAWYNSRDWDFPVFQVAKLEKNRFKCMPDIKFSRKNLLLRYGNLMCNCDGLYLTGRHYKQYAVFNPSCRGFKEIRSPQKIDDRFSFGTLNGIYYNPLMIDYRIVIADHKYYAVFSCRYNKWSKVKEMEEIFRGIHEVPISRGVSFNGSFYWLDKREIIYFDGKDEKFKKLGMPDFKGGHHLYLTSSRDHLCLLYHTRHNEVLIMKRVEGDKKESWIEFKVPLQAIPCHFSYNRKYRVWVSEDVIVFSDLGIYYLIFDVSKSTVVTRKNPFGGTFGGTDPFPYIESLFLQ